MENRIDDFVLFCALAACAAACGNKAKPTPQKEPAAATAPSTSAAALATATRVTTVVPEKFEPSGAHPSAVYAIEGALLVVEGQRVGRVVGDAIESVGKIPKGSPTYGDNAIIEVHGQWPDAVSAVFVSGQARAPQPTYFALTGKAAQYVTGEGGASGWIRGVARVGDSTLLATFSMDADVQLVTVRGPKLARRAMSAAQAGCKPDELTNPRPANSTAAIRPRGFDASPAGTLVSLGELCERRGPAAEIWDKTGSSRIVDLSPWWKKVGYAAVLLKGAADELFAYSSPWSPILRYHDGAFDPVPDLGRPVRNVFVSQSGRLHASDGRVIERFEDGRWTTIARFAEPQAFAAMVLGEGDTLWAYKRADEGGGVYKLRASAGDAATQPCTSWLVYLYEVSDKNAKDFTYPTTRAALSSFAAASEIGLLEFEEGYARHLAATVTSRAQGEALVAHVKATMKEERPQLVCFVPANPRTIPLTTR